MMTIDMLLDIAQKNGMFVALVLFVIWEARKREEKFALREEAYLQETRERENRYIEREEKYREVIQTLTSSLQGFTEMQEDISYMRQRMEIYGMLPPSTPPRGHHNN